MEQALALVSPADSELLSANDVATLLKITPAAVRMRMSRIAPVTGPGVKTWPLELFPPVYQLQLKFVLKQSGLWKLEDVLRQANNHGWKPRKELSELPEYSQLKAYRVKAVMEVYFAALDKYDGQNKAIHRANCDARQKWLEEFSKSCSYKCIDNWAKKVEARGGIRWARIEAYADEKSCDHKNARLENRAKLRVPGELIRAFKAETLKPQMNIAAAYRKFDQDWISGHEVPGLGKRVGNEPLPVKLSQLRKFAPKAATRKLGNQGKAEARRDALPHTTRSTADLRPCELYVLDDTRLNVVALDDLNNQPIEMKVYIMMEVASRRIVGYVIREGSMRASDVDALIARVLRTCGIAHRDSGYTTLILFERGTVACSPQRQLFMESLYPGQLEIDRTGMNGGQNLPGDFIQANSGNWMGKGWIESFNRTLGYFMRHLPGQRGSIYAKLPAMVGDLNNPHKGSQLYEATLLAQAGRAIAYLESNGVNDAPHGRESTEAAGIKLPLLYVSQFKQEFARCIAYYNQLRGHRREGFLQVAQEKPEGGLTYVRESSNDKWNRIFDEAAQRGVAPQRISGGEAAMLLLRARPVTVNQNGVTITVEGETYRYFSPDSLACSEAARLTGCSKDFVALVDPDYLDEIFVLRNSASGLPRHEFIWPEGNPVQFIETLPLYQRVGARDTAALTRDAEDKRRLQNRAAFELVESTKDFIKDHANERHGNTSKMLGVSTFTNGLRLETAPPSALGETLRSLRVRGGQPSPESSRTAQIDGTEQSYANSLANALLKLDQD